MFVSQKAWTTKNYRNRHNTLKMQRASCQLVWLHGECFKPSPALRGFLWVQWFSQVFPWPSLCFHTNNTRISHVTKQTAIWNYNKYSDNSLGYSQAIYVIALLISGAMWGASLNSLLVTNPTGLTRFTGLMELNYNYCSLPLISISLFEGLIYSFNCKYIWIQMLLRIIKMLYSETLIFHQGSAHPWLTGCKAICFAKPKISFALQKFAILDKEFVFRLVALNFNFWLLL